MINKPVCYEPEREIPEVFSGVPSFMGLPVIKNKADIKGYDFTIMGAPWENICTYGGFTGVENATKTIRNCSVRYGGYLPEYDFDAFDNASACDYGDAAVKNGDEAFTFKSVSDYIGDILDADSIPVTFGGDHSLSYPLIKKFAEKYDGNIGIIHFDAHMDNMDNFGDAKFGRCSPFRRLYDVEGFDPKNLVTIGIRGPRNHYNALKSARDVGATVITSFEAKKIGIENTIKKAIEIASKGTKAIYITVCSDALDVAFNPCGPADMCGFTSYEMAVMLHECGLAGAKGFDYMEVYPPDDLHGISSHCASWMAIYFMHGVSMHKAGIKSEIV